MNAAASLGWPALFLLGAYHGINPGMGWLFAVARGMQEKSAKGIGQSLAPIALGHAAAIGIVVLLASLVRIILPLYYVKIAVAGALLTLGLYRLARSRHFRWGGMQVGFRELTLWSFLMASAHGAGLMVLPIFLSLSTVTNPPHSHPWHGSYSQEPLAGLWATLVHTLGYITVMAAIALVVYQKLGLALLRKAWFNLDLVWAAALITTGCVALMV